MRIYKTGPV